MRLTIIEDAEPFEPPQSGSFFNEGVWAINEAVHYLVVWPKQGICRQSVSPMPTGVTRMSFFLPYEFDSEGRVMEFDSRRYGEEYHAVFVRLKLAIENGEIRAISHTLVRGISYLLFPIEVVLWALRSEIALPSQVQKAIGAFQMDDQRASKGLRNRVKTKIVGQMLLQGDTGLKIEAMADNPLMRTFGGGPQQSNQNLDRQPKAIKDALRELFQSEGPGHSSTYQLKALAEVLKTDSQGMTRYHFPLLEIAIRTAVRVKIELIGVENVIGMTIEKLVSILLEDPVIHVYIGGARGIAAEFAKEAIEDSLWTYSALLSERKLMNSLHDGSLVFNTKTKQLEWRK